MEAGQNKCRLAVVTGRWMKTPIILDYSAEWDRCEVPLAIVRGLLGETAGQIKVAPGTQLDYERKSSYSVRVTATDPSNRSASITITINVTDVNEPPEILKKALVVVGDRSVGYAENGTGSVAEYTAAGPNTANLRWRLTGADASDFSINSSGVLTFRSSPNYESPADANRDNTYEVSVTGSSGNIQDTLLVTVDVANVDEEGSVTLSPTRGSVGGQITATLNDADGSETNVAWAWERSENGVTGWSIISGATSATYRSGTRGHRTLPAGVGHLHRLGRPGQERQCGNDSCNPGG